ncbi:endonuclease/exonuclease/phosphatase family protein [Actinoplanes sp. NPDC005259]|uniref:endonuclease/exonuclease/phosphatase family protein n=1 Tax=Actinoplanes sp. NPDC005259 TaxID=3154674 RepID=UPI0033BB16E5
MAGFCSPGSCCAGATHERRVGSGPGAREAGARHGPGPARRVDEAADPAEHRLAAAGRGRAHGRGRLRGRGDPAGPGVPGAAVPRGPHEDQPGRGPPRPGGDRHPRGPDGDHRVRHQNDQGDARGRAAPDERAGGQAGRRHGGRGAGRRRGRARHDARRPGGTARQRLHGRERLPAAVPRRPPDAAGRRRQRALPVPGRRARRRRRPADPRHGRRGHHRAHAAVRLADARPADLRSALAAPHPPVLADGRGAQHPDDAGLHDRAHRPVGRHRRARRVRGRGGAGRGARPAIVARGTLYGKVVRRLPSPHRARQEPRVALGARVRIAGRPVLAVTTHTAPSGPNLALQLASVQRWLEPIAAAQPVIFGGDLNSQPSSLGLAPFATLFQEADGRAEPLPTFIPRGLKIDYLFGSRGFLTPRRAATACGDLSDHCLYVGSFVIPDPAGLRL